MAVALADAEKIQAEMRQVRSELRDDVKEVVASARELSDWRQYVRAAPWLSLGVAAAVGYFLVPPRTVVVRPNAQDLMEVAKAHKLVVQTNQAPQKPTLIRQIAGMATGALLNGALGLASQQFDQFLQQQRRAAPRPAITILGENVMFNRIAGLAPAPPTLAAAKEALQQRQRDVVKACKQTEELVVQNPAAALVVALTVGVAIGWWLKRM